jgi:type III secretory pathway component EscR
MHPVELGQVDSLPVDHGSYGILSAFSVGIRIYVFHIVYDLVTSVLYMNRGYVV